MVVMEEKEEVEVEDNRFIEVGGVEDEETVGDIVAVEEEEEEDGRDQAISETDHHSKIGGVETEAKETKEWLESPIGPCRLKKREDDNNNKYEDVYNENETRRLYPTTKRYEP